MGLPGNQDNNEDNQENKETKPKKKPWWKRIPFTVKLWILGAIGVAVLFLILFNIIASIPDNFLNFGKKAQESEDFKKEYEHYWNDFCEEEQCSEEELKANEELQKSQEAFFKKLSDISKKEKLTEEQEDIILTTIFYNYEIDDFTQGNGAFDLDDSDEIDYEQNTSDNAYKMEKDSIKELVKQFKVTIPICRYKETNDKGDTIDIEYDLEGPDGQKYSLNFYESFRIFWNQGIDKEGFDEAKSACLEQYRGIVITDVSSNSPTSIEAFYDYLRNSEYLDKRPQNKPIYDEYAAKNHISDDIETWTDKEKIEVREYIIKNIKAIVADHRVDDIKKDETYISFGAETAYWWPVGSKEVKEFEGKSYAKDDPWPTSITSQFGYRSDPFSGKKSWHSAIDIAPNGGASPGTVPIIASKSGKVVFPEAGVPVNYGKGSGINGSTYGNYIIIQHTDGNYTLYAHLHADTIMVRAGDSVVQGQVIAYMGTSGASTGTHLHFEVREGQNNYNSVVNPLGYVDPKEPRPQSSIDSHFLEWFSKNFEGSTPLDSTGTKYLVQDVGDGVPTAGPGVNLKAQRRKFEQRGLNYLDYPVGTYVDKALIDEIRMQVLEENFSSIEATLAKGGLTLEKEKIEALGVHMYNTGNISGFVDAYKKYGDTEALFNNYFLPSAKVNGEVWPGLVKRRKMEWELFHNHVYV